MRAAGYTSRVSALDRSLAGARRRLLSDDVAAGLPPALIGGLLAAAAAAVAGRDPLAALGLAGLALWSAQLLVHGLGGRWAQLALAHRLDRRYALEDRLVSAWTLREHAWGEPLAIDALRALERASAGDQPPSWRTPLTALAAACLIAAAVAGLARTPELATEPGATDSAVADLSDLGGTPPRGDGASSRSAGGAPPPRAASEQPSPGESGASPRDASSASAQAEPAGGQSSAGESAASRPASAPASASASSSSGAGAKPRPRPKPGASSSKPRPTPKPQPPRKHRPPRGKDGIKRGGPRGLEGRTKRVEVEPLFGKGRMRIEEHEVPLPGDEGATKGSWAKAYRRYAQITEEQLARQRLPDAERKLIRRYLELLRPRE